MADDNPDEFIRRPDRQPTPEQSDKFENLVEMTVNRLQRATAQEVERTLVNITNKRGFVRRVGGRLSMKFSQEVRDRLARRRR